MMIINRLKIKATKDITLSNLVLLKPLLLKVFNSPLSNNFMNKNWDDNKKINGNISYNNEGIFNKTRNIGK